jgi:PAS domain S-box-containing protein
LGVHNVFQNSPDEEADQYVVRNRPGAAKAPVFQKGVEMNPTTHPEAQIRTPGPWRRLAWLPIPLLIAAILVLKALDWQTAHESEFLLMLFNFVFSTLASLLVVVLFGRSFLARATPGLLLFGSGVLLWGAAGTLVPALLAHGLNVTISVHNILVCLSALCQLAGAILSLKPRSSFREAVLPLTVAYAGALGVVLLVTVLGLEGRFPVFFVQGMGGTPLRQVVLGSATMMFAGAAVLLWTINRRVPTAFLRWYGPALLLVATGLFGIMIESVHGGALSWAGRAAQFLGGAYMLVAALASVRESGAWKVTLSEALEHARGAERASEERYRLLAETMLQGVVHQDADGKIIDMNPSAEQILGKNREQFLGSSSVNEEHYTIRENGERFPGAEHPSMVALRTGLPVRGEIMGVFNPKLGDYRWISIDAVPMFPPGETNPSEVYTVFEDITDRKQSEEALQESETRFRIMANAMPQLAWIARADGHIFWYNQRWYNYTGTTPEQMEGWGWQSVHDPVELPKVLERWQSSISTGEPFDMTFPLRGADGVFRSFLTRGFPLKDASGRVQQWFGTNTDVSELKRVEEALREQSAAALRLSEQEFRSLAEAMPQIVWATRPDGWNIYFNQQWVDYTGMTMEESYGHGWNKPFHPDDKQRAWDAWQRAIQNNERYSLECRLRRADGVYRWWLIRGEPMRGATGEILKWFGTCTDIEEIKRAEILLHEANALLEQRVVERTAALRESEALYRSIGESIDYGVWVCDPTGRNTYASESFLKLVGITQEQCSNFGWGDLLHPDDAERTIAAWQECVRTGDKWDIEHRFRGVDGQWHHVLARGVPVRNVQGEIISWAGINLDISRLKQAEESLRETRDYLENLLNYANAPIIVWDSTFRITRFNQAFERLTGLTADEVTGKPLEILFPDNSRDESIRLIENALSGERWETVEIPILHVNGSVRTVLWNSANILDKNNTKVVATIAQGQDITERKKAEEALRESEERLRFALETSHIGAWDLDLVDHTAFRSLEHDRIFGYQELLAEWTYEMFLEHVLPEERENVDGVFRQAIECRSEWNFECRIRRVDGEVRWIWAAGRHSHEASETPQRIAGVVQDITERKKAEMALQKTHDELAKLVEERTRELSEKEVLLKEVHHRVKNNLQVISSLVSLQADGSRDETVREVLKDVTYRVRSMALVHEKLYQSSDLARIDFAEYSRGLLNYLWRAHGDTTAAVQLKFKLESLSLPIDIAVPCGLILNELAGNALKHAFRGRNEGEVTVSLHQTANGHICLRVRDNGVGLPSGFDWRQPSSLGLRLVQMLSKQIDAEVEVHQEEGTEFAVILQVDRLEDEC